jgi:hypothetical protein
MENQINLQNLTLNYSNFLTKNTFPKNSKFKKNGRCLQLGSQLLVIIENNFEFLSIDDQVHLNAEELRKSLFLKKNVEIHHEVFIFIII